MTIAVDPFFYMVGIKNIETKPILEFFFEYQTDDLKRALDDQRQLTMSEVIKNISDDDKKYTQTDDKDKDKPKALDMFRQACLVAKMKESMDNVKICKFSLDDKVEKSGLEKYIKNQIKSLGTEKFLKDTEVNLDF